MCQSSSLLLQNPPRVRVPSRKRIRHKLGAQTTNRGSSSSSVFVPRRFYDLQEEDGFRFIWTRSLNKLAFYSIGQGRNRKPQGWIGMQSRVGSTDGQSTVVQTCSRKTSSLHRNLGDPSTRRQHAKMSATCNLASQGFLQSHFHHSLTLSNWK